MKHIGYFMGLVGMLVAFSSCEEKEQETPMTQEVKNITIAYIQNTSYVPVTDITLSEASTQHFVAQITPANATDKTHTWSSSNAQVGSVEATSGVFHALTPGETTLKVTTSNGISAQCFITVLSNVVPIPVEQMTLTATPSAEGYFCAGDSVLIQVNFLPLNANTGKNVNFSLSSEQVGSINQEGWVVIHNTNNKEGSLTINASTLNGIQNTLTLKYAQLQLGLPDQAISSLTLKKEETAQLKCHKVFTGLSRGLVPEGLITWSSSDTSIAEVDASGRVSAKGEGDVNISATVNGVTCSIPVTVLPFVSLTKVELNYTKFYGYPTLSQQLTYTLTPADADIDQVVWSNSFEYTSGNISVSEAGLVTLVKAGSSVASVVTVSITDKNGNSFMANCDIYSTMAIKYDYESNVSDMPTLDGILYFEEGQIGEQIQAYLAYQTSFSGSGKWAPMGDVPATWTSDETTIAAVNDSGMITIVDVGNAVISATLAGVTKQIYIMVLPEGL